MKILHIGKYFPPFFGGMENFMAQLLPALQKIGLTQAAIVHQHKPRLISSETVDNVPLYRASCFGSVFFAPLSPWFIFELSYVLKKERPDVLHFHMPNTSVFWALFLPSARKLPWIVHWQSDVIGDKPRLAIRMLYPLYRLFERSVLRRAKAVICTSPHYLSSSLALTDFQQKCTVIPLGLPFNYVDNVGDINKVSENIAPTEAPLRVLVVGRFSYYKGHKYLVNALALLPDSCDVEIVFVGKGELEESLKAQVKTLNISSVRFVGAVSDAELTKWYNWCDCICLPSIERTEAFGMVILEAARQRKPAIVTDVMGSGMNWVVEHEQTGWVAANANSQSLASIISLLSSDPALTKVAGEKAYQRFLNCFSIDKVAEQIAALYYAASKLKSD